MSQRSAGRDDGSQDAAGGAARTAGIARVAHRFRARIRRHAVLNTTWRVSVFMVGIVVVLAGLVMLVAPGPGWLSIIAGFGILATEFVWARHALYRARDAAVVAKQKALDPKARRRNQVAGAVMGAFAVAGCVAYVVVYGLVVPWDLTWVRQIPW